MGGLTFGGGFFGQYAMGGSPPAPPSGPYAALELTGTYVRSVALIGTSVLSLSLTGTEVTSTALTGTVDG